MSPLIVNKTRCFDGLLIAISIIAIGVFLLNTFENDARPLQKNNVEILKKNRSIGSFTLPLLPVEGRKMILEFYIRYNVLKNDFTDENIKSIQKKIKMEFNEIEKERNSSIEMNDEQDDIFFYRIKKVVEVEIKKEMNKGEEENINFSGVGVRGGTYTEAIY